MLHEFIASNRTTLIDRCRTIVASRSGLNLSPPELALGIPTFIDQIITTLKIEEASERPPAPSDAANSVASVVETATLHGRALRREGFTIERAIRDYGDVCQAVTGLASETGASISSREFHTFNRLLDDAMAAAATEYSEVKKGAEPVETNFLETEGFDRGIGDLDHMEIALGKSQLALASTAALTAALTAAQRDAHEAKIRSLHDSLTGLPNRELFDDRMAKALSLAIRHNWTLAVMFLDLDEFKIINDSHGHAIGDVVLKEVAERLLGRARDEDTVCRHGGDEFLYLLMNPGTKANVERIAASVLWAIAQPFSVGDIQFAIKPSIGIAIYPSDGCSGNELIENADAAMYRAKKDSLGFVLFGGRGMDDFAAVRRRRPGSTLGPA